MKGSLTVFQIFTLEGWSQILYIYQDATGIIIATVYYVSMVLLCSMLFMDIIVAVILTNYNENSKISSIDFGEINNIK